MYRTTLKASEYEKNLVGSFKRACNRLFTNADSVNFNKYHKYSIKGREFGGKNVMFNGLSTKSCFISNENYTVYEFLRKYPKPSQHKAYSIIYVVNERTNDIIVGILEIPNDGTNMVYISIRGEYRIQDSELCSKRSAVQLHYKYKYNTNFDCRCSRRGSFESAV